MSENVLLVTQDFPPVRGGIQTYSLELATRFAQRCAWFGVLAPRSAGCEAFDRSLPFEVVRVPGSSDAMPALAAAVFARLVRQHRISLSFHSQWQTAPMAALAKRSGLLARYAVAAHAAELRLAPLARFARAQRGYDRLRAAVLDEADHVLAVSRYTAGLVRDAGALRANISVVSNGVDYERLRAASTAARAFRAKLGLAPERPLLLTVARLVPRKGVDTVLRALPSVLRKVPQLAYCIVGEGPALPGLRQLATDLGLGEHVHFAGGLDLAELAAAYRDADVFVMTPREEGHSVEGFGLVYLEAGAFGVPVVGSRSGGVPDAIVDGETGVLVEPDDVEGLSDALVRLFSDVSLRKQLGDAAKLRVESTASWDQRFEELAAILNLSR